jgi:hypothetical protein
MGRHALLDERLARLVDDVQPAEKRFRIARRQVEGDPDLLEPGERRLSSAWPVNGIAAATLAAKSACFMSGLPGDEKF